MIKLHKQNGISQKVDFNQTHACTSTKHGQHSNWRNLQMAASLKNTKHQLQSTDEKSRLICTDWDTMRCTRDAASQ